LLFPQAAGGGLVECINLMIFQLEPVVAKSNRFPDGWPSQRPIVAVMVGKKY